MSKSEKPKATQAGFLVRLASSLYDIGILGAVCFVVWIPITMVEQSLAATIPHWLKSLLLLSLSYAYFAGFWYKGGATTGMRSWRLQVASCDKGEPLSLTMASVRFFALSITWAAFASMLIMGLTGQNQSPLFAAAALVPGVSLIAMLVTPRHQPLHDLLAGSNVFRLQK